MAKAFSLPLSVHADSATHPPSYSMGKGGSYPGSKKAGAWIWLVSFIWCPG